MVYTSGSSARDPDGTLRVLLNLLNLNNQFLHLIIAINLHIRPVAIAWEKQEKLVGRGGEVFTITAVISEIFSRVIRLGNGEAFNRGNTDLFLTANHILQIDIILM